MWWPTKAVVHVNLTWVAAAVRQTVLYRLPVLLVALRVLDRAIILQRTVDLYLTHPAVRTEHRSDRRTTATADRCEEA